MAVASFLLLLTILLAFLARYIERSWITPGTFFCVVWSAFVLSSTLFVANWDELFPAQLWIIICCCSVHLGCTLALHARSKTATRHDFLQSRRLGPLPYLKTITVVLVLFGVLEICHIIASAPPSIRNLARLRMIEEVTAYNRSAYGYGRFNQVLFERIVFILTYSGSLFGGMLYKLSKSKTDKFIGISAFFTASSIAALYGSRMGAWFGGSLWISAYMATQILHKARKVGSGVSLVVRAIFVFTPLMLLSSTFSLIIRYRELTSLTLDSLVERFSGHFVTFPAFARWAESSGLQSPVFMYGYRTFNRLYERLGVEFGIQEAVNTGLSSSNVFTVFRGLIEDFGAGGSIALLFGLGFLGGTCYREVLSGRMTYTPVLATVYAFTLTSIGVSLFSYNTVILALVLFWGYFLVFRRRLYLCFAGS